MTISIISTENKTANGSLTIPAAATLIYVIVKGSLTVPKIDNMPLITICQIAQNGIKPAIGIYQRFDPDVENTLPLEFVGDYAFVVYVQGAANFRPGGKLTGQSDTGSFTGDIPASTTDLILGIVSGSIGPTALKVDTIEMTYLLNTATEKIGYITPGDSNATCLSTDTGISAGYYVDGGSIYHPAVLITPAYDDYPATLHSVAFQYDHHNTPWTTDYYRKYDNGVYTGGTFPFPKGVVPTPWTYTAYPLVHHDAVYSEAYTEDLPDTWVPGGAAASISTAFVSILTTAEEEDFVPYIIFC